MFCKIDYFFLREIEKLMMKETSQSLLCVQCSEKQQVAQPCCRNETSRDRLPVQTQEQFTDCEKCKSKMVRLHYFKQFQLKLQKTTLF